MSYRIKATKYLIEIHAGCAYSVSGIIAEPHNRFVTQNNSLFLQNTMGFVIFEGVLSAMQVDM